MLPRAHRCPISICQEFLKIQCGGLTERSGARSSEPPLSGGPLRLVIHLLQLGSPSSSRRGVAGWAGLWPPGQGGPPDPALDSIPVARLHSYRGAGTSTVVVRRDRGGRSHNPRSSRWGSSVARWVAPLGPPLSRGVRFPVCQPFFGTPGGEALGVLLEPFLEVLVPPGGRLGAVLLVLGRRLGPGGRRCPRPPRPCWW